jgi:hypothetical protein
VTRSPSPVVAAALGLFAGLVLASCCSRPGSGVPAGPASCGYRIDLPDIPKPFPEPLPYGAAPGFRLRGIKGWAWSPAQYLAEVPFLARLKMNFLMNCYLSMFSDPVKLVNRWWEPIPEAKKRAYEKVVRACRAAGIDFCFAMHPQLFSERPLRYDSQEDFEALWRHFAWMQGLGVCWFSLSYDDIDAGGLDEAGLGRAQSRLVNRIARRLKGKDPQAKMIFCPVYYWGSGEDAAARAYLGALAENLEPEIFVFWTGDAVVTPRITVRAAESYRAAVRHRLVIWDNYPVNDRTGALHLGPVAGRDPQLAEVAYGYMSNPLSPQNEINRLPMSTCADFAWNPWAYDPARSIGQAILHLGGTPGQGQALKALVEFFPGNLACGVPRTDYNCVLEEYRKLREGSGPAQAAAFLARFEAVVERFAAEFPDAYAATKASLREHLASLREMACSGR